MSAQQLAFRVGEAQLALPVDVVREVIRMPRLTRVPHAPPAMLGLANVRGTVIPVLSAAILLDMQAEGASRLIVIDHGEWIGLVVDEASLVQSSDAGADVVDIAELTARCVAERKPGRTGTHRARATDAGPEHDQALPVATTALVAFAIGNQEFAFPAQCVEAVLPRPVKIALMPGADPVPDAVPDVIVGSMAHAGAVLPLLSLRALLALPDGAAVSGPGSVSRRPRVLVVRIGRDRVGLIVDRMHGLVDVPDDLIDALPQALRRGHGEARIQAIARLDGGERLVSVLAADQLLREAITAAILAQAGTAQDAMIGEAPGDARTAEAATEQFLLFRIGTDEFGIVLDAVEEVAIPPRALTRLPRAPAFVLGVMNLRGAVIPVIDQRQRFGVAPSGGSAQRVIVVRVGELQAGFVVDAVSDVVRLDAACVRPAPDLGDARTRVFERVANIAQSRRLILIVSPRELLDRAEQDLLLGLGVKRGADGKGYGPQS